MESILRYLPLPKAIYIKRIPDISQDLQSELVEKFILNDNKDGTVYIDHSEYLSKLPGNKYMTFYYDINGSELIIRSAKNIPNCFARINKNISIFLVNSKTPKTLSRMTHLQTLSLVNSPFVSLKNFINLDFLELTHCDLNNIPEEIFTMIKLEILILNDNNISEIPDSIKNLTNLSELEIKNNNLSEISESINQLPDVELFLDNNKLTNLPDLSSSSITTIYLNKNLFTSEDIAKIKFPKSLLYLGLDDNLMTYIPDELCSITSLNHLSLNNQKISNVNPNIGKLTNLTSLYLDNNGIDNLPDNLANLNLDSIYLDKNLFYEFPSVLIKIKSLQIISINDNQILIIPNKLDKLPNLFNFEAKNNPLTHIPKNAPPAISIFQIKTSNSLILPEWYKNLFK